MSIPQLNENLCDVRAHAHEAKRMASDSENIASDAEVATAHIAKGFKETNRATKVIRLSNSIYDVTGAIPKQTTEIIDRSSAVALVASSTQKQAAFFEHVIAASHMLANEAAELQKSTTCLTYLGQKLTVPLEEFVPSSSSISKGSQPLVTVGVEDLGG